MASTDTTKLNLPAKGWLVSMLAVVCMPQFGQVPVWLLILFGLILLWSGLLIKNPHWSGIPKTAKWGLIVAVVLGVFLSATKANGLTGLSTLLIAGASLKLLELRSVRDGWVLVLVACFIAAENFLFHNSIFFALHGLVSLVAIFSALNAMHRGVTDRWSWQPLQVSGKVLLQSFPIMLLLFMIFPRIGPLWSVQYDGAVAKTGLSEDMEFGSVSQLTRSDQIAFRASFENNEPPPSEKRYWRAISYEVFDGVRWETEGYLSSPNISGPVRDRNSFIDYAVIAEPSARPLLFSLDYPTAVQGGALRRLSDGTIQSETPLVERLNYQVRSNLDARLDQGMLLDRERYLDIPKTGNEQTRSLIQGWVDKGYSQQQIIDELLKTFNQSFTYTLSPPRLTGNRIDQFLFETQAGFCEHFAGSFAFALRVAGIPSRVVGGYLGGEWNPYEQYMLVRQYEAHAWTEAWLPGQGWVRIDPTAAVAPERIESSIEQLFGGDDAFMADTPLSILNIERDFQWLAAIRLRYEALNYSWHRWVLGYHNEQSDILRDWFGKLNIGKTILLVLLPVSAVIGLLLFGLLYKRKDKLDLLDQHLEQISELFTQKKTDLKRKPSETADQYVTRVLTSSQTLNTQLKAQLTLWLNYYHQVRYKEEVLTEKLYQRDWSRLIKSIKSIKM